MSGRDPLVSVVIPTIGRPHLVPRAVRSALTQTLRTIEVIVVIDGPDDATAQVLRQMDDRRLRVVHLAERAGLGGARNAGTARARGRWVALLDDDDEWLPPKLEIQVGAARQSAHPSPIIACRFIDRRIHGDVVLPSRLPGRHEPVSEYLFCRKRLRESEGVVLPSTILAAKELLERVPFRFRDFAYEGSDWLLRAVRCDGVGLEFVSAGDPLAVRHAETARTRMSVTTHWRTSLAWVADNADLLTSRARASFILTRPSLEARRERQGRAFFLLVREAFRRGRPTWTSVVGHIIVWLVPEGARFKIIGLLGGRKK